MLPGQAGAGLVGIVGGNGRLGGQGFGRLHRKILGQKGSTSEAGKGLFVNVKVKVNVKVVSLS